MDTLLPNLMARRDELLQLKKEADTRLRKLKYKGDPEYHLQVDSAKNQFYIMGPDKSSKRKYYSTKKIVRAQQIATYDYLVALKKRIETELRQVEKLIRSCENNSPEAYYGSLSKGRQKLIVPIRLTDEQYVESWLKEPYEGSGIPFGDTEFYTGKEERVRSKSEIIIANALAKNNVPYKYEYSVFTEELGVIHPDFTVLNVRKRKQLYWEHLGKMDDVSYARDNTYRINVYQKNGLFLGDDLIITWETSKMPLDVKLVDQLIRHYLL